MKFHALLTALVLACCGSEATEPAGTESTGVSAPSNGNPSEDASRPRTSEPNRPDATPGDSGSPSGGGRGANPRVRDASVPTIADAATGAKDAGPVDRPEMGGEQTDADAGNGNKQTPTKNADQVAVAAQACMMAGGQCVSRDKCPRQGGSTIPVVCRPGTPGQVCCHAAPECPGIEAAACCEFDAEGKARTLLAECDRGYVTCAGSSGVYKPFADKACTMPLDEPTPESPSRWPGAKSALESIEWACDQLGGYAIQDASCDGYTVAMGAASCCIGAANCPPVDPTTECCHLEGKAVGKECVNGKAICNQTLIGLGDVREMPIGTCKPFEIMRP